MFLNWLHFMVKHSWMFNVLTDVMTRFILCYAGCICVKLIHVLLVNIMTDVMTSLSDSRSCYILLLCFLISLNLQFRKPFIVCWIFRLEDFIDNTFCNNLMTCK